MKSTISTHSIFFICSMAAFNSYALTYEQAINLAAQQSPGVKSQQQEVFAQTSLVKSAGQLPDPSLKIGLENVPIESDGAYSVNSDGMTMQKIALMQEIPNGDKREAEQQLAAANQQEAQRMLGASQVQAMRQVAIAWLNVFYLDKKINKIEKLIKTYQSSVNQLSETVNQGRLNNELSLLDSQVSYSRLQNERDQWLLEKQKAQHIIKKFIGDVQDQIPSGKPPHFTIDEKHIIDSMQQHPDLQALEATQEKAKAQLMLAQADQKPDWAVELGYGNRAQSFEDMVSLEVSVGLPIFSSARQGPRIEAAQHQLTESEINREIVWRDHLAEVSDALAEYRTLNQKIKRFEATELPLAKKSVQEVNKRYEAAQIDIDALAKAQQMLVETELGLIDAQLQRDVIAAWLSHSVGDMP